MKNAFKRLICLMLTIILLCPAMTASAAQPAGFWPLFNAYQEATASGNTDSILKTGDAILRLYASFPLNDDIAAMSYNIYFWRFENNVFEKRGDYDAAVDNANKVVTFASYLGFNDAVVAAQAKAAKLSPMTGVYALSDNQNDSVYYGAKYEPQSGAYFGRVLDGAGSNENAAALEKEAVVSLYYSVGRPDEAGATPDKLSRYGDGAHVVHIALNFPEDGQAVSSIAKGTFDNELQQLFASVSTLKSPVLIRIGAEMNLWGTDPEVYKAAYRHVAGLIRSAAPNAALVWSPNYVGAWGSDMGAFYPGDDVTDWVGVSLYTNSAVMAGQTAGDVSSTYFGRGLFADCVLSLRAVADFAAGHAKPVIITEGGTGILEKNTGTNYTALAVKQITKAYSALTMVYPNVKALIYFDTDPSIDSYQYAMSNSPAVQAAYDSAVASNPSLISKAGETAPSYVRLDGYSDSDGTINLAAYSDTIYSDQMTVTYSLSGKSLASQTTLPYRCTIDAASLQPGSYPVKIGFNDGAGYTKTLVYTLTKLTSGTVVFSAGDTSTAPDAPASWAKAEVGGAISLKLVPDALQIKYTTNITRGDFCRLIVNLIAVKSGKSIDEVLTQKGLTRPYGSFTDTTDKNVLAAYALGIVNGRGNGLFDPGAGITREEAAKMLSKAANCLSISSQGAPPAFSDAASFSGWAADAIGFVASTTDKASGKTVMGSVGGGRFDPKGMYTYQQADITMLRLYNAG